MVIIFICQLTAYKIYFPPIRNSTSNMETPQILSGALYDISSFLSNFDQQAMATTNHNLQREVMSLITSLTYYNAQIFPWLRSNMGLLTHLKKIHIHNEPYEEMTEFFTILERGTFQLEELFLSRMIRFGTDRRSQRLLVNFFVHHCTRLQRLKIPSQLIPLFSTSLPQLCNLSILFYQCLGFFPNEPFWSEAPRHLETVEIIGATYDFVVFFFDYCVRHQLRIKSLALLDIHPTNIDLNLHLQESARRFGQVVAHSLKTLKVSCNTYIMEDTSFVGESALSFLFVSSLEVLEIDFLTKENAKALSQQCPSLKSLIMSSHYGMDTTSPFTFAEFLSSYKNTALETLELEEQSLSGIVAPALGKTFPRLVHFKMTSNNHYEETNPLPAIWKSLHGVQLESLAIEKHCVSEEFVFTSEVIPFLIGQSRLKKFYWASLISQTEFTVILNTLSRIHTLEEIEFNVDFKELFVVSGFMPRLSSLRVLKVNFLGMMDFGLEDVIQTMERFLGIFQQLDVRMPHLKTLELIMNSSNLKIHSRIRDFESVYKPLLFRNCPRLVDIVLGWN